jgi:phage gp36-like protein
MAYADKSDMETRYGKTEIANLEADGERGELAIIESLNDAAAEINGYLCRRYKLPLPAGNAYPLLKWASCDIARYRLWEGKLNDDKDTVYVRYKRVVKVLEDLAEGKIALVDELGVELEPSESNIGARIIVTREKVFTNEELNRMDYGDCGSILTE